eukprot:evm.model.scf_1327.2 EVM.evm.TU.scf_1327.2   scf_1327:37096-38485(+)
MQSAALRKFLADNDLYVTAAEAAKRRGVVDDLQALLDKWVRSVAAGKGYPSAAAAQATCPLCTLGSYRLGVYLSGSDIDAVAVGPVYCKRMGAFFAIGDPISDRLTFEYTLRAHKNVTDVMPISEAAMPVMKFKVSEECEVVLLAPLGNGDSGSQSLWIHYKHTGVALEM